jgi:AraC-like DNA-binding protein
LKTVIQRFGTSDIDEANRHPPPGWTQVVYRLAEGPFRYEVVRVDLGDGLEVEHARFVGATRLVATLAADAVHLLFPYGRDLRLSGVAVEQKLVVVSPPGVQFEGSTQVEGCGFDLVARGASFASLLESGLAGAPLLTPGRTALVMHETPAAEALRLALEGYFSLLETREDLALEAERVLRARDDLLELMRLTLMSLTAPGELELKGTHPRRRELAVSVEEWLWRQLDDPLAPPMTLGAAARDLDISVRSIQLAVEEHFGVSFVRLSRLVRLHQVHGALVLGAATSVSEVATRHGFWHLGRFSRYYREVFGQPPSRTVRGARTRPPLAPAMRRALMRRTLEALRRIGPIAHVGAPPMDLQRPGASSDGL